MTERESRGKGEGQRPIGLCSCASSEPLEAAKQFIQAGDCKFRIQKRRIRQRCRVPGAWIIWSPLERRITGVENMHACARTQHLPTAGASLLLPKLP